MTSEGTYQPMYKAEDVLRTLDHLEERQNKVLSRIEDLQQAIVAKGRSLGLTQDELQSLAESHVPSGIPVDIVVRCSPSRPPYPLLILYNLIEGGVRTCLKNFVHSSVTGRVDERLIAAFSAGCPDAATLRLTVIWREDPANGCEPTMIVAPRKHTPVKGIVPICRYLARQYCPSLFPESTDSLLASQIDSSLDSISFSYLNGNTKEKASVLRHMNSSLGSSSFLVGTTPTLADVVYYATLASQSGLKLGGNVKDWMKRCHGLRWCNFFKLDY